MLVEQVKIFSYEFGGEGDLGKFEEEINEWLHRQDIGAITKMTQSLIEGKQKYLLVISFIHSAE
jgi:hypothetical protein